MYVDDILLNRWGPFVMIMMMHHQALYVYKPITEHVDKMVIVVCPLGLKWYMDDVFIKRGWSSVMMIML